MIGEDDDREVGINKVEIEEEKNENEEKKKLR